MAYKYTVNTSGQIYKDGRLIPKENYNYIPDNYVNQAKAITNPKPAQTLTAAQSAYSYAKPQAATPNGVAVNLPNTVGNVPAVNLPYAGTTPKPATNYAYDAAKHQTFGGQDYGIDAQGNIYKNNIKMGADKMQYMPAPVLAAQKAGGFGMPQQNPNDPSSDAFQAALAKYAEENGLMSYDQGTQMVNQMIESMMSMQMPEYQQVNTDPLSYQEADTATNPLLDQLFASYEQNLPEQTNQQLEAQGLFGTGYGARIADKNKLDLTAKKAELKNTLIQQLMNTSRADAQNAISNGLASYNANMLNKNSTRDALYNAIGLKQDQIDSYTKSESDYAKLQADEDAAIIKQFNADRDYDLKVAEQRWLQGGFKSKAEYEAYITNIKKQAAIQQSAAIKANSAKYKKAPTPKKVSATETKVQLDVDLLSDAGSVYQTLIKNKAEMVGILGQADYDKYLSKANIAQNLEYQY